MTTDPDLDGPDPLGLSILGGTVRRSISAAELETFPTPKQDDGSPAVQVIVFDTAEVVSACPITGQPDFYKLRITYGPADRCIESKSLKLYLWSFAGTAQFSEQMAGEIADAIHDATDARWTKVRLEQTPRGGIGLTSIAERQRDVTVEP